MLESILLIFSYFLVCAGAFFAYGLAISLLTAGVYLGLIAFSIAYANFKG